MAWRHAVLICMTPRSMMAGNNRAGKGTKFRAHNTVRKLTRKAESISHFYLS